MPQKQTTNNDKNNTDMIDDTPWARLLAVILFSGFIFACVPFAYYLADVERHPIEHTRISALEPISYKYTVSVLVHAHACSSSSAKGNTGIADWTSESSFQKLTKIFQAKRTDKHPLHHEQLQSMDPASIINTLDSMMQSIPTAPHEMNVVVVAMPEQKIAGPLHLGPTRRSVLFVPCNAHATTVTNGADMLRTRAAELHAILSADRTKDTDVISVPEYHVSMTLLDASPIGRPTPSITWVGSSVRESIQPFLDRLQGIATVHVDSQIVRFAKVSEKVHKSCGKSCTEEEEQSAARYITPKDLQRIRSLLSDGFTLESGGLSPLVSPIHMILYAPPHHDTPLYIVANHKIGRAIINNGNNATTNSKHKHKHKHNDSHRLGFYIPRYGGVVVWNINSAKENCNQQIMSSLCTPNEQTLDIASDLWVSQLRHVLGVPLTSLSNNDVTYLRSRTGISDWELDTLARGRLSHFAALTTKSLNALSTLVQDMSHMAVPVAVGEGVATSLVEYDSAQLSARNGDVVAALEYISNSFNHARVAEMDPSMAPLRYFPPEHLAAVYLPLIVPLMIPILMGFKKGVAEWKEQKAKRSV